MNKLAIIESPFAGRGTNALRRYLDRYRNIAYARLALRDAIDLGFAPMASHLLYTQVLDDNIPRERALGIDCGLAWRCFAEVSIVYCDRGITNGMQYGIAKALDSHIPIRYRKLIPNTKEFYDLFPEEVNMLVI